MPFVSGSVQFAQWLWAVVPPPVVPVQTAAYIELPAHRSGWIADRLGIAEATETECLELLVESGQIERVDSRWQPTEVQSIDTRSDPRVGRRLKGFWTERAIERLGDGGEGLFSYNVFTVSSADYERLCEMQRAYYRALRAAISTSSPAERVVVTNLSMFPLDGGARRS